MKKEAKKKLKPTSTTTTRTPTTKRRAPLNNQNVFLHKEFDFEIEK